MTKNICHNCINHFKCINYRYNGVVPSQAEKYTVEKGIYYIEKCNGFNIRTGFKFYNFFRW